MPTRHDHDPTLATDAPFRECLLAFVYRWLIRLLLKPLLSPRWTISAQRRWLDWLSWLNRPTPGIDVVAATVAGLPGEWLHPAHAANLRDAVVLYLHGGAFCVGSPRTHRPLAMRLARDTGLSVFAADYRLAPEHPWPAAIDDAEAAFLALAESRRVLVVGDSAGGTLALLLAQRLRDRGLPGPAALGLLSPVADLAVQVDGRTERLDPMLSQAWLSDCFGHWLGKPPSDLPTASPIAGSLSGLAPTFVHFGEQELLAASCERLVAAMQAAGVSAEGHCWLRRWHVFQLHANTLPSANAALSCLGRQLLSVLDATEPPRERTLEVLIMGAGMSGLCMLRGLKQRGQHDVLALEKQPNLGGTWWDNTYPGAQVDVPAPAYAFSFAPNPDWQQRFASASEIQRYQQRLAEREGLLPHLRFNTRLTAAHWQPDQKRWRCETACGQVIHARHFVCSTGPLNQPRWPDIPGLNRFAGTRLHSARWDHQVDLTGKRVAVIGTGSTAVQLIPPLAARAGHLTVLQRTPNWILPRLGRRYRWFDRGLARVPGYAPMVRASWVRFLEWVRSGFDDGTVGRSLMLAIARRLREWQLSDAPLRALLTPNYPLGCKRLIFANDYYPVFRRPNVVLETGPISEVIEHGVRLADGRILDVDVLVCATGFETVRLLASVDIRGRSGACLADRWQEGPSAFHGITVPDFPNFFLMLGPNTATGHTSTLLFIEPAVQHALAAMAHAGNGAVEVAAAAFARHNDALQQRLQGSVWAQCQSWYRAANGRVVALFPGRTREYVVGAAFRADDYHCH
ncbi:hypothetical protein C7S18_21115 [Ahniella affigens]|uniref:Alpha/beta hydrolase fold-3 domain-containing protein n=1 Tax=Ahniella affigens TaxID=2021234 RepID=A0A2P1PXE5_9GAMM|nr:alpha/beta hydrolase fold domain-containing protein [Ahniella affigens]AVP99519.1 hypothetical protein C7S18_21115 [Ahniella affigens]